VPEVERQNRVIKERARAIIQTMPYAGIPRKIRIALIQYVVYWLNNIPESGQEHSPRDLILGEQKLDYEAVCRIPFGAYVQVHDDPTITNTMQSRTTGAISLGATGNAQGTHRFFSLKTGEVIVRRTWTELPIPSEAVDKLQEFVEDEIDNGDLEALMNEVEEEEQASNTEEGDAERMQEEIEHEQNNDQDTSDLNESEQPSEQGREEEENRLPPEHEYNLRPNRTQKFQTLLYVGKGRIEPMGR